MPLLGKLRLPSTSNSPSLAGTARIHAAIRHKVHELEVKELEIEELEVQYLEVWQGAEGPGEKV